MQASNPTGPPEQGQVTGFRQYGFDYVRPEDNGDESCDDRRAYRVECVLRFYEWLNDEDAREGDNESDHEGEPDIDESTLVDLLTDVRHWTDRNRGALLVTADQAWASACDHHAAERDLDEAKLADDPYGIANSAVGRTIIEEVVEEVATAIREGGAK